MVSTIYLFSFIVTCSIIIQICSSMAIDDQYLSSDIDSDINNKDGILIIRRSAHFIFPPTSLIYSTTNYLTEFPDVHPRKRQSFGRKHHWDAFFGRR